jgi:hypothetical protein
VRDPIWQFIGVIIALLPWMFNSFAGDAPPSLLDSQKLMIYSTTRQAFLDFPEPLRSRTRLTLNGHEERDVRLFIYFVEYSGQQPLREEDFKTPVSGVVPQDRKIIAVQRGGDTKGPLRLVKESGHIEEAGQESLTPVEIKKLDDQRFEVVPAMMNPGDWFKIEIYTAANNPVAQKSKTPVSPTPEINDTTKSALPEITWTCRVAGVKCPAPFARQSTSMRASEKLWFLKVKINHRGWSIYFIVLFTIINTILLFKLAQHNGAARPRSMKELFIIALAIASSLSAAEVLADRLFNSKSVGTQPLISTIQLSLHGLLFLLLALPIVIRRRIKNTPANVQTSEAAPAEDSGEGGEIKEGQQDTA